MRWKAGDRKIGDQHQQKCVALLLLAKKEARAEENGTVGRHIFGFKCKKVQQMEAGRCLGKGNKYRLNEQIGPLMSQFSFDN